MQKADLGQNCKGFSLEWRTMVPLGIQTGIWKHFSSALLPAWLRRALSDLPACSGLSITVFHPCSQHQSSFATTLRFFFFQIPFHILLGSSGFVFLQRLLRKWPEQLCLGPAVTASLPDVLPEGFNRQLKSLCFSSFCDNSNWRSATEVSALTERQFLRNPSNCTKWGKLHVQMPKAAEKEARVTVVFNKDFWSGFLVLGRTYWSLGRVCTTMRTLQYKVACTSSASPLLISFPFRKKARKKISLIAFKAVDTPVPAGLRKH